MSMLKLHVVLFQPEIPQNTGNIARSCAASGVPLHLIKPLGFSTRDRYLKRAGLDYWHMVTITYHNSLSEFLEKHGEENLCFITKKAARSYDQIRFEGNVFLIFGKETEGLPESILRNNWDRCFGIPMRREARSLNVSNAVAIVLYEALRKNGFPDLILNGKLVEKRE